jgi:hypothetical protein
MQIVLEATGDRAGSALAPLKTFFQAELGALEQPAAPATPDGNTRDDVMLAVTAIIVSLPGTVLATLQLLQMAQLKRRLDNALQDLRDVLRCYRGDAALRVGDKSFDLRTVSAEQVLDAIAEEEQKR